MNRGRTPDGRGGVGQIRNICAAARRGLRDRLGARRRGLRKAPVTVVIRPAGARNRAVATPNRRPFCANRAVGVKAAKPRPQNARNEHLEHDEEPGQDGHMLTHFDQVYPHQAGDGRRIGDELVG